MPSARNIFRGVAYAAAVVAPLLLLVDLEITFPEDWAHHLWMIGYHGEYFRQHGEMPTVVNITGAVGIPQPVFYGYLLYPLLGLLSAPLGAALALRIAVSLTVAVQFWALLSAGRNVFRNPVVNYAVGASVIWGTYSLTNLYNRGAIAEYFATSFLVTAAAFATTMATGMAPRQRYFHGCMAGVFLILSMGTHPPTAGLAGAFLLGLGIWLSVCIARGQLRITRAGWLGLGGGALLGAAMLAPWVYASFVFTKQLAVTAAPRAFVFLLQRCDSLWARFAPYPYDLLSTESGIYEFGTAYLEAPINPVLIAILLWNLELCRRSIQPPGTPAGPSRLAAVKGVLCVAIGWFLFLAVLSVSPAMAEAFRFLAPYVQYVYRLVSHCNLALLVAVFASGALVAGSGGYRRFRHETAVVAAGCVAVAALGVLIKLQHAGVVGQPSNAAEFTFAGDRARLVSKVRTQLAEAWSVPTLVPGLEETVRTEASTLAFPVGRTGPEFGRIAPANIEMKNPGWVATNAIVFPWLELFANGKKIDGPQLARRDDFFAIYLPVGSHEIRAVWRPTAAWQILHRISQVACAIVLIVCVFWTAVRLFSPTTDPRRGPRDTSAS